MSTEMNENVKRWTAKRNMTLVLDIIQGKTTGASHGRCPNFMPRVLNPLGRCSALSVG